MSGTHTLLCEWLGAKGKNGGISVGWNILFVDFAAEEVGYTSDTGNHAAHLGIS